MKNYLLLLFVSISIIGFSQEDFPTNGVRDKNHNFHAFINATVYVDAETIVNNGYLFIKDGRITYVGGENKTPRKLRGS